MVSDLEIMIRLSDLLLFQIRLSNTIQGPRCIPYLAK